MAGQEETATAVREALGRRGVPQHDPPFAASPAVEYCLEGVEGAESLYCLLPSVPEKIPRSGSIALREGDRRARSLCESPRISPVLRARNGRFDSTKGWIRRLGQCVSGSDSFRKRKSERV